MTIVKKQKPIAIDAYFKYKCPDDNCGLTHWLNLKECQTKNFKVVCDCGVVFKPKLVDKLKVVYVKNKQKKKEDNQTTEIIPEMIDCCSKLLIGYGFSESESIDLINKAYSENPTNSPSALIKHILQNLGDNTNA
jgi:hypothetical protein